MPRSSAKKKMVETPDEKIGQDHPRAMKTTGPAKDSLEPALVEAVEKPVDKERLAMLAFNEEPVEVYIQPTTNPEDEQIFEVSVNGEIELFRRGETKTVRRKFVERLARAKLTTYRQKESLSPDGVRGFQQLPSTGLRYNFSVTRDVHPRGADWLRSILNEA